MKSSQIPILYKCHYQLHFEPVLPSEPIWPRDEVVDSCRKFIGRFDEDQPLIFSLLSSYNLSIDEFLRIRRSIWPDSQFYSPDFSLQRMLIAVGIVCDLNNEWIAAPMCRLVLGLDNGTMQNNMPFHVQTDLGQTFFHGLARKVGITHGTKTAGEWHTLFRDVLGHLANIRDLSQHGCQKGSGDALVSVTPLSDLISQGLEARIGACRQHVTIRPTDSAAVLAGCEKSISAWLADLYESGIDLQLYGQNEKEHFLHQEVFRWEGYPLNGMMYSYLDSSYKTGHEHVYWVRLINFHFGRFPSDWKFWWSEASDAFAGDFWHLVESGNTEAVVNVPGAWVD